MKYYKVKQGAAGKRTKKLNVLVTNELFTEKEKNKYNISDKLCEVVNISKNKTYFFFGARFAAEF